MSISVQQARDIRNRRRMAENHVFEKLWEGLDAEIRVKALTAWSMDYRVPIFKLGLPRYDPVKVARRMRIRLRNRGFQVSDDEEETPTIRFSWKPPPRKPPPPKPPPPGTLPPSLQTLSRMRRQVQINHELGWE